jgi:hypothetical protein
MSQRYAGLSVDNDLYFGIDRYYSSGIFLKYGALKKQSKDSINYPLYSSKHWTLGQEINTPSLRLTEDIDRIDYPYSGWLYIGYEQEYFKFLDFGYGWGIQLGTTGAEASFAKFMQNTYHIYILNLPPLSWAYSIPQSFHVNFETALYWGKQFKGSVRWVQENRIQLGTFRTAFQTRFGFQWGNLRGLPFFGQRLEIQDQGFSFFIGVMMAVNIHDYSLSGSFFESNSIYTLQAERSRATVQAGVMWHRSQWRFRTLFNYSSSYITTQRNKQHPYLNISIFRLF